MNTYSEERAEKCVDGEENSRIDRVKTADFVALELGWVRVCLGTFDESLSVIKQESREEDQTSVNDDRSETYKEIAEQ